ncbi:MAG: DUF502 domain-containing protein [Sedimentisphaerales bacterium]
MQALRNFKTYFLRGLAALLPTILTVWLFVQLYLFIQHNISAHINRGVVRILVSAVPHYPYISDGDLSVYIKKNHPVVDGNPQMLAEKMNDPDIKRAARIEKAESFWVYGGGQITGFVIVFLIIVFVGAFLASVIGRAIWRMFEHTLMKTPLLRAIYPYIKQVTDFFLASKKISFNKIVAVEFPRKGTWAIGMVTGPGLQKLAPEGTELLTVFVPTSPSPVTGFVLIVPKTEVVELDISIEEVLRFIISGGVISPSVFQSYPREHKTSQLKNE